MQQKMYILSYITNINGQISKTINLYTNYNEAVTAYDYNLLHDVDNIITLYNYTLLETNVHHESKIVHEIKLIDNVNNVDILDMHLFDVLI